MAKCWLSAAVIGLFVAEAAFAQDAYLPLQQNKPAVMPEPVPCFDAPMNTANTAPPRPTLCPDSPNSLPANTMNAWCDEYCAPPACYFNIGYLTMAREKLNRRPVAIPDTVNNGVDTGGLPDLNASPVADFHDIDPRFSHGVTATVGCHWDSYAVELSGFYLSQSQASRVYADPGRLATFFNVNGDVNTFPLGFEGNAGMWLQDDIIRTQLQTALASGELNFRFWPHVFGEINMLVGVRYLDIYERVGIFTGDDDLVSRDIAGNPNPVLQADYTATAHNRILGGQFGVEWNKPITWWLAYSMVVKGAWGVNFLDVNTALKRGDGFAGPAGHYSDTNFSHLYEAGFFLNFPLRDNIQVRAGYNLLWVLDITEATDVVDFNLANPGGRHDPHGSSMYHGPSVEFHILF